MKKIYRNVLKGGLACAMLALGTTACTDDHFDIQQGTPTTGQTLWQNVEANPELKSFAEILKRTTVLRNDYDKSASMKYSDFLSGSQYLTVWLQKMELINIKYGWIVWIRWPKSSLWLKLQEITVTLC